MRQAGLKGVHKRRFRCTTRPGIAERWAPDLVDRHFVADRPNTLWVADATFVPTLEGFLYLAIVLDVFSRLVVGWAMAARLASQLVLQALEMAYAQRGPREVIHHSDHGSEYTAIAFGTRCTKLGVRPSMGSVGDCYDNAMAESFFATLESEVLDRNTFRTRAEARSAIFCWIHSW
jgi:putative transposase